MSLFLRKRARFSRFTRVAIVTRVGMTFLCAMASSWTDTVMALQTNLSELPITFPVQSPEVAAYFGRIARPYDVASLSPSQTHLLPEDALGQKMVGFWSWVDAERELETLSDQVDMVMYNPEHWELTPANEPQELVAIVQEATEFTHARGLRFMFAPDRRFAEAYLGAVAPYVDAALLQAQRLQHDPQAFASWVLEMTDVARSANPEIQIYVQVAATRGAASEMFAAIQTVSNDIDGIAIWSMPRSLDVLQEFVTMLRESPPPPPTLVDVETTAVSTVGDVPGSTPVPAIVAPAHASVSTSSAEVSTANMPTSTVVPTLTPWPQVEAERRARERMENIGLIVGGTVAGLLLGFGLGRRQRGSRP